MAENPPTERIKKAQNKDYMAPTGDPDETEGMENPYIEMNPDISLDDRDSSGKYNNGSKDDNAKRQNRMMFKNRQESVIRRVREIIEKYSAAREK
jgi:hypothetical protein